MIDISRLTKGCMVDNKRALKENLLEILKVYEPIFINDNATKTEIENLQELLNHLNSHGAEVYIDTGEVLKDVREIFHNSREIWS